MNEDVVLVELTEIARTELAQRAELVLPRLIVDAGPAAVEKFLEFFAARWAWIRSRGQVSHELRRVADPPLIRRVRLKLDAGRRAEGAAKPCTDHATI